MSAKKKSRKPGRPETGVTKDKPSLCIDKVLMQLIRKEASRTGISVSSLAESYMRAGRNAAIEAKKGAQA